MGILNFLDFQKNLFQFKSNKQENKEISPSNGIFYQRYDLLDDDVTKNEEQVTIYAVKSLNACNISIIKTKGRETNYSRGYNSTIINSMCFNGEEEIELNFDIPSDIEKIKVCVNRKPLDMNLFKRGI